MKTNHHKTATSIVAIATLALPALAEQSTSAAEEPGLSPAASPEHPIVAFLRDGTVNLDVRFRYEHADIDALGDSNAFTVRTRLGYTTTRFEGVQAMVELEDNRAANYDQYNAAGLNGRADIERFWLQLELKF